MCTGNLITKLAFLSFLISSIVAYNYEDYFPNFECSDQTSRNIDHFMDMGYYETTTRVWSRNAQSTAKTYDKSCIITGINETAELDEISSKFNHEQFSFYTYDGYRGAELKRHEISEYFEVIFQNSTFEKFSSNLFRSMQHINSLSAKNVGLTEINREDFFYLQKLSQLYLSHNKIKIIDSVTFFFLKSLTALSLSNNEIEVVVASAFDECGKNLTFVDLSSNRIKVISEQILNVLGKFSTNSSLIISHNKIEKIETAQSTKAYPKEFRVLDLSHNKLRQFTYNCTKIDQLLLNDNMLEELDTCNVDTLNVTQNNLTLISSPALTSLLISNNANLKTINIKFEHLEKLEIRNLPSGLVSYESLQNASNLAYLDMENTRLGTPKIQTFSRMKFLVELNLKNTGLSDLDYGMFGHQKSLETLDISYNNLKNIDLEMLSSLYRLKSFDVSGNNLTRLENIKDLKKNSPILSTIGIADNNWECSYLSKLITSLNDNNIFVKQPLVFVTDSTHLGGIKCERKSQMKISSIESANATNEVAKKLNEIVEQVNADEEKIESIKLETKTINSDLSHIQRELLDIKTKLVQIPLTSDLTAGNNSKGTADLIVIRNMMEQLNNFTLEKQKLANDQLQLKIDQLYVKLKENSIEHDKFLHKESLKDTLRDNHVAKYDSQKSVTENGSNTTNILLTVVITSLVFIGIIFGYSKVKNLLSRRSDIFGGVRARSTNTLNTTVEIPIGNCKY